MKKVLMALLLLLVVVGCQSKQVSVENAFFSDGLLAVQKDGKWGYINTKGNFVIPALFDKAGQFFEGEAIVDVNGNAQLINKEGKFLLDDYVDKLYRDEETHLLIYVNNGRCGLMSASGKIITEALFDSLTEFSEGYAIIRAGTKHGFINTSGKIVVSLIYDAAKPFSQGLAAVKNDDKWGFINPDDEAIIGFNYAYAYGFDAFGNSIVETVVDTVTQYHLITKKGVSLLSNADMIKGSGPVYAMKKASDYTLHKTDGSRFNSEVYTNVWYLEGYLANVELDGEDLNIIFKNDGSSLHQALYDDSDFDMIINKGQDETVLVVPDGNFIDIKMAEETIRLEANGLIQILSKERYIVFRSGKVGVINGDNEIIVEFLYDFMSLSEDGYIGFLINNQIGFMNSSFDSKIPATFDDICLDYNIYNL